MQRILSRYDRLEMQRISQTVSSTVLHAAQEQLAEIVTVNSETPARIDRWAVLTPAAIAGKSILKRVALVQPVVPIGDDFNGAFVGIGRNQLG